MPPLTILISRFAIRVMQSAGPIKVTLLGLRIFYGGCNIFAAVDPFVLLATNFTHIFSVMLFNLVTEVIRHLRTFAFVFHIFFFGLDQFFGSLLITIADK